MISHVSGKHKVLASFRVIVVPFEIYALIRLLLHGHFSSRTKQLDPKNATKQFRLGARH